MRFKIILIAMLLSFLLSNSSAAAEKITLNAKELDLHDTIMLIANLGGLNVSVDDSVKGTISISLDDIEAIEALKIIARTKDLNIVNESGIYIITSIYLTNAMMSSYVLPVKYGDAEKFREAIVNSLDLEKDDDDDDDASVRTTYHADGSYTEYRRKRYKNDTEKRDNDKRVMVNKDVNALILFGTVSEYQRAKLLLNSLDIPIKQVSLEAKVLAVNKSAAKDLGIEWKWSSIPQLPEHTIEYHEMGNRIWREDKYERQMNENTGYGSVRFGRGANGAAYEWYYGAKINALITNGKAKMLSRPHVLTIQGNEAIMSVGDRIPVPKTEVSNNITTTSYDYEESGIILKVTPRINEDGSITANVYTEVSTPQYVSAMSVYRFNKRSANTIITLKDGEPMIIGGLIGKEEENAISKIPILGDLPILGALFKNHHKSRSESELMIFLTAHVIQ